VSARQEHTLSGRGARVYTAHSGWLGVVTGTSAASTGGVLVFDDDEKVDDVDDGGGFRQSTSESWAQFNHDNVTRAEHERMASIQMRTLSDNILHDTARDVREQADAADNAFERRVREMEDCKAKLMDNLKKVSCGLLHSAGREMSTSQSAVMLCGWGVKAGMVHSTCG